MKGIDENAKEISKGSTSRNNTTLPSLSHLDLKPSKKKRMNRFRPRRDESSKK